MRWLTLVILLWAQQALAAQVAVISGEHNGFTRLALSQRTSLPMSVVQTADGYDLTFPSDTLFDLGSVFDRIPKTRLTDVSAKDGVLSLTVDCLCHLSLFVWQGDWVIIDVKDGPDPTQPVQVPHEFSPILPVTIEDTVPREMRLLPSFDETLAEPSTTSPSLSGVEQQLAQSIARAASQGLLTTEFDNGGSRVEPDYSANNAPTETAIRQLELHGNIGLSTETVLDRDMPNITGDPDGKTDESVCLPEVYLSLGDFQEDIEFSDALAATRSDLTTEFDLIPPGSAERLAKTYLLFGFGAEAAQALRLDSVQSKERNLLGQFAVIVDGGSPTSNDLKSQFHCDSMAAIWAFAAFGGQLQAADIELDLIQRNFGAMPSSLRQVLGNRIAENFLKIGDPERAGAILEQINSADVAPEPDLVTADLVGQTEGAEAAAATLESIATTDVRITPQELLALFAIAEAQNDPVDADLLILSESLRYENRHDPISTELAKAEVGQLVLLENFDSALELLGEIESELPADDARILATKVTEALVRRSNDFDFLNHAFGGLPTNITADVQNGVARRLLALRLPDRAADLLQSQATGTAAKDRRYLRAEAEVQMGHPRAALEILSGIEDEKAAAIRTTAMLALGQADAPIPDASVAEMSDIDIWRAGQWDALIAAEDPVLSLAGKTLLYPQDQTDTVPTLAATQSALDRASETETLIGQLLNRFEAPSE